MRPMPSLLGGERTHDDQVRPATTVASLAAVVAKCATSATTSNQLIHWRATIATSANAATAVDRNNWWVLPSGRPAAAANDGQPHAAESATALPLVAIAAAHGGLQ